MSNISKTLLVGNGINYLSSNSITWKELLKNLTEIVGNEDIYKLIDEKPFTLVYEEIVLNSNPKYKFKESTIKQSVAALVNEIGYNDFHSKVMRSDFPHIITTNYDYSFQNSLNSKSKESNLKEESKYSVFRRHELNSKYIWHIHGECGLYNSIMLGHEHYAGQLQKLRAYATSNRRTSSKITKSPFKSGNRNFDIDGSIYSWFDIFLRDEVHILGLSLDYTEIDLWWLLSYKQRLQTISEYETGKTKFHTLQETRPSDKSKALHSILRSFGVEVIYHGPSLNKSSKYESMYENVIENYGETN